MSRDDVDTVRAMWDWFNRMRLPDFDSLHADVRWHTRGDLLNSDTYHGHDGVARLAADWMGAFDELRVEAEELIDTGDRVVAVLRLHGRPKGTDHEVEMTETHVCTMLDGKVVEIHEFPTRVAALESVGLTAGA
jgi:ketosteroid isomerase-like protein